MPKKIRKSTSLEEIREFLDFVVTHMDERFVAATEDRQRIEKTQAGHSEILTGHSQLLDEILFTVTGQEQRISGLEDKMRKSPPNLALRLCHDHNETKYKVG